MTTDGRATRTQLEELWVSLRDGLRAAFKGPKRPPVEMLSVTRRFLRDNLVGCPTEADRAELEDLFRLYSRRLAEALSAEVVPASVLAEGRAWLTHNDIRADVPRHVAAQLSKQLGTLDIPFKAPKAKH